MKKTFLFPALALLMAFAGTAQTNPAAVGLPFTLNSQSSVTLPGGVAVHRFTSIPTVRTLSPATGDLPNQGSSAAGTAGGWYDLGTDGIGLLSSSTNPAGAVIVAINTTGLSSISVSWLCKTIKNQASRDNSVALQYRLSTSGNFTDVGTGTTWSSAGTINGASSSLFTEVLPAAANNQAVVQLRWIYWESVSTSGSRDKISVDDISISGTSAGSCAAPSGLAASGVTGASANLSWGAVSGVSSYEYALSTSATPPGSGVSTAATSYAASGLAFNTLYYFYVRSVCSGSGFSAWSSTSFTTLQDTTAADSTITLMTYNLLNYPGSNGASREPDYRTIMNDVQPDILVVQELSTPSGITSFLSNVLNFSTSTYNAGTFINGPDSDNGIYYKSAKFQFISNTPIQTDLRDINQFMLRYLATGDTLILFSAHLKADNTSPDAAQRALEIDSLRKITNAFAAGKYFVVCGDFNIYGSTESAYQKLIVNGSNANGKFNDVISMTGTWNNSAYAINHTQSPRTTAFGGGATGGLDDRFDLILFSNAIVQPGGFDVVSGSYKAYGNDGAHYNAALNTPPYTLYSSTIASALHDASDHLPVVVKLSNSASSSRLMHATALAASPVVNNNLVVYPNPAHTQFFVKANAGFAEPVQLQLLNANGQLLQTATLAAGSREPVSFDVSGLVRGIYYLSSPMGMHKIAVQ